MVEMKTAEISAHAEDGVFLDDAAPKEGDANNSWEHQIGTLKQEIEDLQESYEQSFLEIGKVLIQARAIYKGHGDWLKWLKNNAPFSVRHAQRLIRVAEMFDDATLVSRLGLTASKAYLLTRIGKDDLDLFCNRYVHVGDKMKHIKNMTRHELELAITTYLKEKLELTNHEEVTPSIQLQDFPEGTIEVNFENFKEAFRKIIDSIKSSDSDARASWISELDDLYRTSIDRLTSTTE